MNHASDTGPGLFARLLSEPGAALDPSMSPSPLIRRLDLALKTRPGETLGAPTLGIPCFADLVHGDRGAVHALRSALRRVLSERATTERSLDIRAHLDPAAAALEIEVFDRAQGSGRPIATATIDALGVASLCTSQNRRRR